MGFVPERPRAQIGLRGQPALAIGSCGVRKRWRLKQKIWAVCQTILSFHLIPKLDLPLGGVGRANGVPPVVLIHYVVIHWLWDVADAPMNIILSLLHMPYPGGGELKKTHPVQCRTRDGLFGLRLWSSSSKGDSGNVGNCSGEIISAACGFPTYTTSHCTRACNISLPSKCIARCSDRPASLGSAAKHHNHWGTAARPQVV